jgi:prepilin-type N-terminal cleavage/methylation domain-containing protein
MSVAQRVDLIIFGKRSQAGFSMLEVLVVAAIMAIAAALGVPNYVRWNAGYQLKQATTELQSSLSLARMVAMNRNTTVTATPALFGGQLTMTFTNAAGTAVLPAATEKVDAVTALAGGPVLFNSMGLRVGGGAGIQTITVTNRYGVTYSIGVTPGGKIRWCASLACT